MFPRIRPTAVWQWPYRPVIAAGALQRGNRQPQRRLGGLYRYAKLELGAGTKECGDHIADPDRVAKRPPRSAGFLKGNEYRYPFGGRPIASMIFFMLTGLSHRATLLNRLGMADAS